MLVNSQERVERLHGRQVRLTLQYAGAVMQMFEYIIVLISIVIGLALTHLMQGIAGLIQHPGRERVWWVHLVWVAYWFLSVVFWWWFEFRLQLIETWTFSTYFFVVCYAFFMYLVCAILFPRDLEGYDGYKDYFLSRRGWFFGMLMAWAVLDVVDSRLKGADHLASLGVEYIITGAALIILPIIGIVTRRTAVQGAIAILMLSMHLILVLRQFDTVN